VYATCSILEDENEAIVQGFPAQHPEFELIPASQVLRSSVWNWKWVIT
jgi:16S rRNA (cytosine967-C5)-methyltransferase